MTNISPSLKQQLYDGLLRCGPFDSSSSLGALFVDARISEFRNLLPDAAPSRQARVEAVVGALSEREHDRGGNALVLLLHVLRDRTSSGDACYGQLGNLADALARELTTQSSTAVPASSSAPAPNAVPTSGSFRQRKRQLVQERLDAYIQEFEAASRQLLQTLGEVERTRIKRQMDALEKQIQETEAELAAI